MKIRTQFVLILFSLVLILLGMVISLLITNQQANRLLQQEEVARRIAQGANNLSYIAGDYLVYGESQQRVRWETEFALFSNDVSQLEPTNPEQQTIVTHIKDDQARLQAVFKDVSTTIEKSAQPVPVAITPTFLQVAWSRMEVQNQGVAFEAALLSQKLRDQADGLKLLNVQLMFSLIGIFGLSLLINYFWVQRRILRSIAELHAGTMIVGSGNLDFAILSKRSDEIGDLTNAFNQMTVNLKQVTTSRDDLEHEIIERKQAESALRESQARLEAVFAAIPNVILEYDANAKPVRANKAALDALGIDSLNFTRDQAVAKLGFKYLNGNLVKHEELPTVRALRGKVVAGDMYSIKPADRREHIISAFAAPLYGEDGNVNGAIALWHDITALKQAEAALQETNEELQVITEELRLQNEELRQAHSALEESEERLSFVLDACHVGIWEMDIDCNTITCSPEYDHLYGYSIPRGERSYEAWLNQVIPDDRARLRETHERAIQTQSSWDCEFRILRLDGQIRWIWALGDQRRNPDGTVQTMAGIAQDITERKQAEEQLRYQAAVLSNVNDAIIASDAQFRITAWNVAAEDLYGWKAEEVIGGKGLEIINTQWPEKDADEMRRIIAETGRWRGEATQSHKNGTRFPVEVSSIALHNDNGQVTGYVSVNRDITERKWAEEQIARSNQKMNEILTSIQDDFYVLDREWKFIYANRLFTSKVGKEPEDFIGNKIWEMFPKHVGTIFEENLRAAMEKREVRRFEIGGKYTSAWYRMAAFPSAEGITVLGTDITDLKRAEDAARESQRKYQDLIETTADFIWEIDGQGKYTYCSPQMETLWGIKPDEMLGKTPFDIMPSDEKENAVENFKLIVSSAVPFEGLTSNAYNHQDQLVSLETSGVPFFDGSGSLLGFRGITRDVTERKRAEDALRQSKATLLSFYDSAPFMMGIAEIDGNSTVMISGNRSAAEFYGMQPINLPGKTGLELNIPTKYERLWVENYRRSQHINAPINFEYEYPRGDGSCWLSATVSFIGIGPTSRPRFSFVVEDITGRKRAEQALLLVQADLEHAQEVGQIGSWRLDVRRNMLIWSNETYRIFGVPLGTTMTYESFLESIHPDDRSYVSEQWNANLHGKPYDLEHRIIVNGQVKWVREKAYLEHDNAGELSGGFGIIQDITQRKQDESALRDSEERYRGIVETAEEGIATHDPDGTITYINQRMADMLGYSPEEMIGRSSLDFVDDEEKNAVIRARKRVKEQGSFSRERKLFRKDGSTLWTLSNISPRRDEAGNFIGYLAMHTDITVRKHTEEKLRESEERFSAAFRSSPVGINIFRLSDGCSVDANDAFLSMVEYSREELIGHSAEELNLFVDPEARVMWMQEMRERGAAHNLDLQIRGKSGRIADVLFSLTKIELAGESMGLVMAVDVTERKQAEKLLMAAHAEIVTERNRLQAVMEALPVGVSILNEQGGVIQANLAFEQIWGDPLPETNDVSDYAVYKAWWADTGLLLQPDEWASAQVIKIGEPVVGQVLKLQRFDGTHAYVVNSAAPIFGDGGQIQGCAVAIMDITAEKKAEDALKESEKKHRELVQFASAGIYEIDFRTRKFISVNDAMCQMSGYTREELLNMSPLEILEQESQDRFKERIQKWLAGDAPMESIEYVVIKKDGSKLDALLNVTFTRDASGNPLGASVIGYDITERKKAERNLELINRTLKALSNSNQAMMRAESETDLLNKVCKIIVEDCGYAMVWVGYAENDAAKSVRPVASAGFEEGYLETLKITWADTERGRGPTGTAIRTGETSRCRNMLTDPQFAPWREQALKRGYQSSMVVPIFQNDKPFGAITIYAREPDVFYEDEEKLLIKLASDLAYGIQMIRLREALRNAYVELEQRVAELQTLMDVAPVAIGIGHDSQGKVITANRLLAEWLGAPGRIDISFGTPEAERPIAYQMLRGNQPVDIVDLPIQYAAINGQKVRNDEITLVRADGRVIEMLANADPLFDADGRVRGSIATYIDITERKRAENELRAAHDELEQRVQERTVELERRNVELQTLGNAEREQRQLAEALVKAALVLGRSLNQDEVLQHILEQIQGVIPYQFASITLLDGETFYDVFCQGSLGSSEAQYELKRRFPLKDFPLLKKMRQTGQPVLLPEITQDSGWTVIDSLAWSRSFLSAPLLVEKQVIGFVNLFSAQPLFFTQAMCERLVAFASHAAVAIQNAWLFERVRAGSERLQSLSRRLVEIQENERLYIARELHDEAGQMLTSLMVDLRVLEKEVNQPEIVLKKIAEMEASLNEVFDSLHRIAMALRPATLDHLGLVAALHQYVDAVGEKHGIKISFTSEKVHERLAPNVETVLYRITQEALTNVIRHACATQVDVVLMLRKDKLVLIVEDNGLGFDPSAITDGGHLGLFGMRERAETIGGKLVIESAPGKGTTVLVEVGDDDLFTSARPI